MNSLSLTRHRDSANSPEFEFWNLGRNPSPATLHSADELFSHGFLLPLHLIPDHHPETPQPDPEPEPEPGPSASITSSTGNPILTASKRWKEIFKRAEKPEKDKKKDKNNGNGNGNGNGSGNRNNNSAELNINIWPFSRSRSEGNNTGRSRPAGSANRKVSSAPCSRSNSSGSRRSWPNSPGRTGVHLGRSSPVWQVRRSRPVSDEGRRKVVAKGRVLNLNVPVCIGYRQEMSCRSEENAVVGGGGAAVSGGGSEVRSGGGNGNLFGLRGLFSKKGVLTA